VNVTRFRRGPHARRNKVTGRLILLAVLAVLGCDDDSREDGGGDGPDASTDADTDMDTETETASDLDTETEEEDCIPEGFTAVVSSGDVCCPGLDTILADSPGEYGGCIEISGVLFCTICGNGSCDAPENPCNCPDDCGPPA